MTGQLLVARGNPAERPEPSEESFHEVARPVTVLVIGTWCLSIGSGRDDGFGWHLLYMRHRRITAMTLVGQHGVGLWCLLPNRICTCPILACSAPVKVNSSRLAKV